MTAYPDTSALVPLYAVDSHSQAAERLFAGASRAWVTPLHRAEVAHALERQVFYGRLDAAGSARAWADFEQDLESGLWLRGEVPPAAFERCADLARRHAARLNPRTLDSLHVACALDLGAAAFWTFDARQAELARTAGLAVSGVA